MREVVEIRLSRRGAEWVVSVWDIRGSKSRVVSRVADSNYGKIRSWAERTYELKFPPMGAVTGMAGDLVLKRQIYEEKKQ